MRTLSSHFCSFYLVIILFESVYMFESMYIFNVFQASSPDGGPGCLMTPSCLEV